jgi:DNA repair protein RecO (recombination protein O)
MHWSDASIILSARKYGENSAVVRVLAREHGVFAGVVRGASSKNNRGIIQSGNVVSSHWQARLSQQLGSFKLELLEAHAAHIMQDAGKLCALTSACALTEMALPERHPYPKLFAELHKLLHTLSASPEWQEDYIKYEVALLTETGFGLDLSECAATGRTDDLIYVSPKSGRAVCRDAGEPYKDKLLPLPSFLGGEAREGNKEILAGLSLTGYFLEYSLMEPYAKQLPPARTRLYNLIKEQIP